MICRRTALLVSALAGSLLLFAAGCGPKPYDVEKAKADAVAAKASAAEAPAPKPLLSAVTDHPAPAGVTANLDQAESAAAGHPNDIEANRTAALTYYKLQAFAQAIPAFQRVIQLSPDDAEAHLYLGYSQMAAGALDDAVATFEKVPDLKSVDRKDISTAYLQIGSCDWALQRDDKAAEAFSRSIGINSHQGMASLGLGTYAAMKGRTLQAHDFFLDAAKDLPPGPERARAYACLGRLSEENKDVKGAAEFYNKAAALDPKSAWAHQGLARLAVKGAMVVNKKEH